MRTRIACASAAAVVSMALRVWGQGETQLSLPLVGHWFLYMCYMYS